MKKIQRSDFPEKLLQIPDPPSMLYMLGNAPKWEEYKVLCVVGARRFTKYGREVCEKLIAGLAGEPIIILSGLAMGIDGIAHRAALKTGLLTVAVPGSGLSRNAIYPRIHVNLADEIVAAGGCILSEFEPDFHATPYSFPQRNRIMAGLADAVIIIECEKKSGTLITARLALDYNRDVGIVPGSIFSVNSEGPHFLLGSGAAPITSSEDILKMLGIAHPETKDLFAHDQKEKYSGCGDLEKRIVEILRAPLARDIIIETLANASEPLSPSTVLTTLSILEIKGFIKESCGEVHLT